MQEQRTSFLLNLPVSLKREVERKASENRRTITREMQVALERHVSKSVESKQS